MFDPSTDWFSAYAKDANLRKKYSQAGLYKNEESFVPLWTIDWYADRSNIYLFIYQISHLCTICMLRQ